MAGNRIGRINEEIRKELSALLRTVKDPRVSEGMLTITRVDTTSDLRYARVYISALNCADEKGLMKGLKSAAGYLRHELGQAIDLRYTPELQFFMDDSIAHGAHTSLVMRGAPYFLPRTTLRPLGPRVTLTVLASWSMPDCNFLRASSP